LESKAIVVSAGEINEPAGTLSTPVMANHCGIPYSWSSEAGSPSLAAVPRMLTTPEPRLDAKPLRWAIVGPGEIAADFAATLARNTRQRLVAVGSRSAERAARFAQEFSVPLHGSYDIVTRPEVEAVYVAALNPFHAELALRAIDAGKHVLVEKPFAMNAAEALLVADAARSAGVLAMEAMWTRYLPTYRELDRRLHEGEIGEISLAASSVGWGVPVGSNGRVTSAELGGGVTLDMGVYALWFAQWAVGRAERVMATGRMRGAVDEEIVVAIDATLGKRASVTSTIVGTTSGHGEIVGSLGRVTIAGHLVFPTGFDLTVGDRSEKWRDTSLLTGRAGLAWQAAALAGYVDAGLTDSPLHSLDDTVALARTMDAVLAQVRGSATAAR
jgi:predicted dehydrogenase